MPIHEKIAWIIRSSREQHGYSQEYMADMLGIVQSTYAAIESGKTSLTVDRLIQIIDLLQLNLYDVMQPCMPGMKPSGKSNQQLLVAESKELYEKMIMELKDEIFFLRGMVRERENERLRE